jgi:hypothetical protein
MRAAETANTEHFYFCLPAMLMGFLAYEAYLNFLGERVAREIWENERAFFSRRPYRGVNGKLRKITEILELPYPDGNSPPFSTLMKLKDLRDTVSHGKPERFEDEIEHHVEEEPVFVRQSKIRQAISKDSVEVALNDVAAFIEELHRKAKPFIEELHRKELHRKAKPRGNDLWFGDLALEGPSRYEIGSTSLRT